MNAHLLDEAESIRVSVSESLPPDIRNRLLQGGFQLTVSASTTISPIYAVVVDEEGLAEQELAGHMVSLRKDVTGVDNTVFVSTKGYGRHAARIKIAIDPPNSFNETCESASMAIHNFGITGAYVPPRLMEQAKQFIERNRDVLLGYWNGDFDTLELGKRLRPPP
jgi:hypothetical protein